MSGNVMILVSNFKHFLWIWVLVLTPPAHAEILWDDWYTISEHALPYSYYNEKAEIVGKRAKIQENRWTKKGKKISSEALGAVAKNTDLLEPELYNFRTQNEFDEEKNIDGSIINNGKIFSVKNKTGIHETKPLRAEMLPKLIFSSFFPVWINKNYKRINGVQPIEFQAILEDQVDSEVHVIKGTAYEMRQDEIAKETHTRKLRIEFNQLVAIWWVTPKGDAVRIEVKALDQVIKKTDRKTAEAYLKES